MNRDQRKKLFSKVDNFITDNGKGCVAVCHETEKKSIIKLLKRLDYVSYAMICKSIMETTSGKTSIRSRIGPKRDISSVDREENFPPMKKPSVKARLGNKAPNDRKSSDRVLKEERPIINRLRKVSGDRGPIGNRLGIPKDRISRHQKSEIVFLPQDEFPMCNFIPYLLGNRGKKMHNLEEKFAVIMEMRGSSQNGKYKAKTSQPVTSEMNRGELCVEIKEKNLNSKVEDAADEVSIVNSVNLYFYYNVK